MSLQRSNERFLATAPEKHLHHALTANKGWWEWRLSLKAQFGFDVWKLPVCERCEGYALWHKDEKHGAVGYCQCGHITKNPITVQEYYEQGHHVDRTMLGKNAPLIVDRQKIQRGR